MEQGTTERRDAPVLELLEVSIDATPDSANAPEETGPSMRRRVAMVVSVVTALLIAIGIVTTRTDAVAAPTAETGRPHVDLPPPGLEGFAELYVAAYLTGDGGLPLRHFYAAAPEAMPNPATRFVRQIATLGVTASPPGGWDVRLAADVLVHDGVGYQPDGVHHFVVGVIDTPSGLVAAGLPVRIPAPPPAPVPASRAEAPIEDANLHALVTGFLEAYLTGDGDLRAYAAADSGIDPITPAPFDSVSLDSLHGAALDDQTWWLRAMASAQEGRGSVGVEHHLLVTKGDGTWSIASLETGPPR